MRNKKIDPITVAIVTMVWLIVVILFLYMAKILVEVSFETDYCDYCSQSHVESRRQSPKQVFVLPRFPDISEIVEVPDSSTKNSEEPLTFEETVSIYVFDICQNYPNVDPYIVLSVIYQESRFTPNVSSGKCVGLMQVSTYHHQDRAKKLAITDFYDPYSNILLGVDFLNELLETNNGDVYKALTRYNGGSSIGRYAIDVVNRAEEYREGYFYVT